MEKEKWLAYLENTDTTPAEESNTVVQQVTQMLSDCQGFISKLNASRDWNYTELCLNLKEMQWKMKCLSWCIEEMTATGSSSNPSEIGSDSTQNPSCPTHYQTNSGFESIEFIDQVLWYLYGHANMDPKETYCIMNSLKYAIRAGKKGPWEEDAYKCADYLCRAIRGRWLLNGDN